jgi:hypothetical protein
MLIPMGLHVRVEVAPVQLCQAHAPILLKRLQGSALRPPVWHLEKLDPGAQQGNRLAAQMMQAISLR